MNYIFDHIFKTAGTTFNLSYLHAAFPPKDRYVVSGYPVENQVDLDRLRTMTAAERRGFKVIAGHNTGQLRNLFPEARWLTLVRSPADRVISAYLHARFHRDAWDEVGREIQASNIPLKEFVEQDFWGRLVSVHDGEAKVLLGPGWDRSLLNDRKAVTELIRSRFYLVGYSEAFELFLFYLHVTDGFPLILFNNRLVRKERRAFYVTAEDGAAIERHIQADRVVYECARQEFDRRVAKIWNEEWERAYHRYLEALEEFRHATRGDMNSTALYAASPETDMAEAASAAW